MSDQFERFLADQFTSARRAASPAQSIDEVLIKARRMRPLPRWLAIIKEPPMRISSRVTVGSPMARVVSIAVLTILLAVLTTGALVAGASLAPSDGLVTEQVEPGVERIVSDDAGHDLDEKHPTYRYDMDNVFVAPDGTVWLATSYRDTDNEANPPGGLVWALGQSGTSQYPVELFCFRGDPDNELGLGVTCFDPATGTATRYLTGTSVNAVAAAPDGTYWAVGADGAEGGGLYHITPE